MSTFLSLSSCQLGEWDSVLRVPVRPKCLRSADFEDRYDSTTLFYDAFWSTQADAIVLIGPPLLNLESDLPIRFFGYPSGVECSYEHKQFAKMVRTIVKPQGPTQGLIMQAGRTEYVISVQPNVSSIFRGKRVIFTLSKDNPLQWIADWCHYHVVTHKCDAALIYDNGSSKYPIAELGRVLDAVPGLSAAVVVPWPFPYGVFDLRERLGFNIGDSIFCQLGAFEHARQRLLAEAASVLNADIDELVMPHDRHTVFEAAESSATGFVSLAGVWVENVLNPGSIASGPVRHADFYHVTKPIPTGCEHKWAAVPSRIPDDAQWHIHRLVGISPDVPSFEFSFRHFKGINTAWDTRDRPLLGDRGKVDAFDPDLLVPDAELKRALVAAFGAEEAPEICASLESDGEAFARRKRLQSARQRHIGRLGSAIALARSAVAADPHHPGFKEYLGEILSAAGENEEAEKQRAEADAQRRQDPIYHVQIANWARATGQFDLAEVELRAAIALDPTCGPAYLALSSHYMLVGDQSRAVEMAHEALGFYETSWMYHHAAGALAAAGQGERAVEMCRHAVAMNPEEPGFRCTLAGLLNKHGRTEDAEQELLTAYAHGTDLAAYRCRYAQFANSHGLMDQWARPLDPSLGVVERDLAKLYLETGRLGAALKWAERLKQVFPLSRHGYSLVHRIYLQQGEAAKAQQALLQAISVAREHVRRSPVATDAVAQQRRTKRLGLLEYARLLSYRGDYAELVDAREELGDELWLVPEAAELMVTGLSRQNQMQREIEALRKKVADAPQEVSIRLGLARLLSEVGEFHEADRHVRACFGLDVERRSVMPVVTRVVSGLAEADRLGQAAGLLRQALKIAPSQPELWNSLSRLLLRRGKVAEAESSQRRAIDLAPARVWYQVELGRILVRQGKFAQASETLERALQIKPGHASASRLLSSIQHRTAEP